MSEILPLRSDADTFSFIVTLSDVDYLFRFFWNDQSSEWYFDLYTATGTALRLGTKLALGVLAPVRGGPPGRLIVFAQGTPRTEPGRSDLGKRVKVAYV